MAEKNMISLVTLKINVKCCKQENLKSRKWDKSFPKRMMSNVIKCTRSNPDWFR